ncbi:hypothetical protein [Desulfovibrio inopinatus]|uniref:hypothetical protein n=1 Tax=Desulfovibrio inopinatus TaxID=102109 RepID=UPI00042077F2|nr:hypothetical protein [Desulfovibrio inopinatus]
MKVQFDQLQALYQGTEAKKAKDSSGETFEDILARQLEQVSGDTSKSALVPPPGQGMVELTSLMQQAAQQSSDSTTVESTVMANVENLLSEWENYADQLGSGQEGNLRKAYDVLENIRNGVEKLKDETPKLGQGSPLNSLVNEMEVLAVTEQIKFNRGDYI